MSANIASIVQPTDQGVIYNFNYCSLTNIFCTVIAVIDSDSPYGTGQSQLKTWKGFTSLDARKNIHDSWEEVNKNQHEWVWKKVILTHMDDFEGFKISAEEMTADVVEIAN